MKNKTLKSIVLGLALGLTGCKEDVVNKIDMNSKGNLIINLDYDKYDPEDSEYVTYDSYRDEDSELFLVNLKPKSLKVKSVERLTDDDAYDGWIDFSPDGTKIVYSTFKEEIIEIIPKEERFSDVLLEYEKQRIERENEAPSLLFIPLYLIIKQFEPPYELKKYHNDLYMLNLSTKEKKNVTNGKVKLDTNSSASWLDNENVIFITEDSMRIINVNTGIIKEVVPDEDLVADLDISNIEAAGFYGLSRDRLGTIFMVGKTEKVEGKEDEYSLKNLGLAFIDLEGRIELLYSEGNEYERVFEKGEKGLSIFPTCLSSIYSYNLDNNIETPEGDIVISLAKSAGSTGTNMEEIKQNIYCGLGVINRNTKELRELDNYKSIKDFSSIKPNTERIPPFLFFPIWTNDYKNILYLELKDFNVFGEAGVVGNLYIIGRNGKNKRKLAENVEYFFQAPSGEIVYTTKEEDESKIYIMNLSSTEKRDFMTNLVIVKNKERTSRNLTEEIKSKLKENGEK